MRRLEVSANAQTEIIEIRHYTLVKWGEKQSNKYISELQNTIELLKESPLVGIQRFDLKSEIFSFPYVSHIIYYRFNNDTLFIMALLHKSSLPKNHLNI